MKMQDVKMTDLIAWHEHGSWCVIFMPCDLVPHFQVVLWCIFSQLTVAYGMKGSLLHVLMDLSWCNILTESKAITAGCSSFLVLPVSHIEITLT